MLIDTNWTNKQGNKFGIIAENGLEGLDIGFVSCFYWFAFCRGISLVLLLLIGRFGMISECILREEKQREKKERKRKRKEKEGKIEKKGKQ